MTSVFRKTTLERLSSPDRLDGMLKLTSPMSWLGIAAVAVLAASVVIWSFVGRIPTTVDTYGFLTYDYGANSLYNTAAGEVSSLLVHSGDCVEAGTPLAEILTSTGQTVVVPADQSGMIREDLVAPGEYVVPNQALFRISPDSDSGLSVVCYVSQETALQLEPGMEAVIYLDGVGDACGWMEGQVACVDRVHTTAESMAAVVGNDAQTIEMLMSAGPVVAVTCTLREDSTTASGYYFSGAAGAEQVLYGGSSASVQITLGQSAPIAWVFPMFGGEAS